MANNNTEQNEFTSLVKHILDATYNALKEEAESLHSFFDMFEDDIKRMCDPGKRESFENIKINKYIAENFDERARRSAEDLFVIYGLPAVDINDNTAAFSIYDAYMRNDFNVLTYYFASFYKLSDLPC